MQTLQQLKRRVVTLHTQIRREGGFTTDYAFDCKKTKPNVSVTRNTTKMWKNRASGWPNQILFFLLVNREISKHNS